MSGWDSVMRHAKGLLQDATGGGGFEERFNIIGWNIQAGAMKKARIQKSKKKLIDKKAEIE